MKKILLFLMILTFGFTLASCGEEGGVEGGDGNDDIIIEGGEDTVCEGLDGGEHAFGNPEISYSDNSIKMVFTCVNCGHVKKVTQKVDSKVEDDVEWDNVFEGFKLTNFTMNVHWEDEDGDTQDNHCIVTENAVYYHIPGSVEYYAVRSADGSCIAYVSMYNYDYETGNRTKMPFIKGTGEAAEQLLVGAQYETVLQISFAENFSKFTYDAASATYSSTEEIAANFLDEDGSVLGQLYCFNSKVKVVNGEIYYISSDYTFHEEYEENDSYSFEYANIGVSSVTIPQEVIDGATEGNLDDIFGGSGDHEVNTPVVDTNLDDFLCSRTWYFEHYYGEVDGDVIQFGAGEIYQGVEMARESIYIMFYPDGTGEYVSLGSWDEFTWWLENGVIAVQMNKNGFGVVYFEGDNIRLTLKDSGLVEIYFN